MGKKPVVVTLRVYRGKQMSYDAQGNVQNENQLIKLKHDTVEWRNFIKNITTNGYLKVDVEDVKFFEKKKNEDGFFDVILSDYDKDLVSVEVEKAVTSQRQKPMSPSEKKIAELEAKIEALTALASAKGSVKEKKAKPDKKVMENLRVEYAELNGGKKAFPGWDEDQLREKIVELKNDQA